jgi:hydrogenase expression/formation protein HypC
LDRVLKGGRFPQRRKCIKISALAAGEIAGVENVFFEAVRSLAMCLAIPGKILSKENIAGVDVGRVQFGAITRQVALGFVPEAEVGDYVMVHVGFAISKVDAEEAQRTYEILEQLGALEEELGEPAIPARLPS